MFVDVRVHVRTLAGGDRPWNICMATYVDMTEVQRAARAQREATAAAEAADRIKSQFLATMSHEIRTPLNGVLGMAQVMEADELSPVQREPDRHHPARPAQNLLTILNDILDLAKIEAGKLELECVEFDLDALVGGACATLAEAAQGKGLALTTVIDPQARGAYLGDPVRVRQILVNLVSNAIKFTDTGGGSAWTVAAAETGFRLSVSDTGAGVAADRIEKIFDKFVQADSSTTRRYGGTGLGLAISREIAEAMGGRDRRVDSALGRRQHVHASTCHWRDARLSANDAGLDARRVGGFDPRRRRNCGPVLAAEDNLTNQMVLRTLLEQFGLQPRDRREPVLTRSRRGSVATGT